MLCLLVSALLPAALAQLGWSNDGGNTFRTNFISLNYPVVSGSAVAHSTSIFSEPEENTVSMVEEQLLQSPLVTNDGQAIVVQTDSCTIALLPDPKVSSTWPTPSAIWSVNDTNAQNSTILKDECEAGGIALDTDNTIYFLDSRNRAVYALIVTTIPNPTLTWKWTANFPLSKSIFPLDASLLVVSSASQLWVPLKFSLLRPSDGIAWVIDTDTGATNMTVPLPEMGCSNEDNGNALVNLPGAAVGLAQLSSDDCGLPLYSTSGDYVRLPTGPSFDDQPFGFEMGQHSHPVYDPSLNQLYYFDFLGSVFEGPQLLCCWDTILGKACDGWNFALAPKSGCVTQLPVLSTEDPGITYRYSWIAGGLLASQNLLFVVTSGPVDEDVLMRKGFQSTLSAVDTTTGNITTTYTTSADFYNSAPLVVSGSDGSIVIVSTSDGSLVAFVADGPLEEPLWRSQDLPGIPAEDLPACTYAFLSATSYGTILATTSAGGAVWQDEKAYSAVANGVFLPAASASPSPSPTAGVTASPTNTGTGTATGTATAAPGTATGTRTATPTRSRTRTSTPTSTQIIVPATPVFFSRTPAAGGGGSNVAPATGLSPGAAAGVSLLVIALAAGGGLYIFAAYFGGGPALAAAWASIAGVGGGGGGAAPTSGALRVTVPSSGTGEKLGLLSSKAAQDRFAAQ